MVEPGQRLTVDALRPPADRRREPEARDALFRQRLLHRELREVRQLRHAGLRRGHSPGPATARPCIYCSPWCVEWAAMTTARPATSSLPIVQPRLPVEDGRPPGAQRRRPTRSMMNILDFDHGVDLPRDGHPADEDVLLDDLQRGPRLHLRAGRRQGRHDRLRRVLPDHDRRHAAADQDLRPGDPVRDARGGRHRPPQRSLSRRAALPRAHLLQAVLHGRRAARLRGLHRPHRRDRRHGAGRVLRRGDRDLPRGPARPAGEDQEEGPGRRGGLEAAAGQCPHARARTMATCAP